MKTLLYEVDGLLPETVKISLHKELDISEDIDSEVDKAARMYGYYAVLAEKADTRYQKLKFSFDVWVAENESTIAEERQMDGLKAYTEKQMNAFVKSQPKYRAYQLKLVQLDEHKRILRTIAKAFDMKSHQVQTKASNRRHERAGVSR